jgi:hypothetical protein
MRKIFVVRLTDQEQEELQCVIKKLKGTGQKVRRAHVKRHLFFPIRDT